MSVECLEMSDPKGFEMASLQARLRDVEQRFEQEMRARGFDPAQDENLALTASLAKLYTEREHLRAQLQSLADQETTPSD